MQNTKIRAAAFTCCLLFPLTRVRTFPGGLAQTPSRISRCLRATCLSSTVSYFFTSFPFSVSSIFQFLCRQLAHTAGNTSRSVFACCQNSTLSLFFRSEVYSFFRKSPRFLPASAGRHLTRSILILQKPFHTHPACRPALHQLSILSPDALRHLTMPPGYLLSPPLCRRLPLLQYTILFFFLSSFFFLSFSPFLFLFFSLFLFYTLLSFFYFLFCFLPIASLFSLFVCNIKKGCKTERSSVSRSRGACPWRGFGAAPRILFFFSLCTSLRMHSFCQAGRRILGAAAGDVHT